ncbi:TrmB family transcriptional regulator sugar-binding domain-containing protein [Halomarina halobia]|uniref:TrmB family transcriptional regulator sugar-binding domain-containing protein n=1 Tax=Halomarina halobia TaxID=3033386 RepID=A0ABD6AE82_9EURY|nr:TrmB family transcriptional regulator sugar-binding domain-containing protein [Halomarina sp. PSR21]
MNDDELRDGLREAGLSQYQIRAYVTLLELGTAAATTLAEEADVPRSRIYDVLQDLAEEGYVETYEQDSLRARAREPTRVFEELRERARVLSDTAEEIRGRWERTSVEGHRISVLKRAETAFERAESAIRDAENQVQLSVTPEQFERLRPALRDALRDDLFVLVSINTSPERPTEPPADEALRGATTEVRHRHLPAPFVALIDRSVACFAPHRRPVDRYGVIFEDETLTYIFHWYFQAALWESWPVVYTTRDDGLPAEYVDIRECIRDVAPLLTDGARIAARVRGEEIGRREPFDRRGEIVDALYATAPGDEPVAPPTLSSLAGQATLVLEVDGEEYGIGGWGAILEDVEAQRVVVESVEFPDGREAN